MAAKFSGGYKVKVINQNDSERFECMLCHDIIKMATHGCMNHVFCKECLEEYVKNNRNKVQLFCPAGCRIPFDKNSLHRSKIIDRYINKIACECPDCSWKGDLYDFVQQHERNCVEKKVSCHLCSEFIKRKDLQSHASFSCSKRKIVCIYCKDPILHNEYVSHEDVCQNSEVECYYKKFGCTQMIKRKTMEFHNQSNNQKHLFLVTKYFEDKNESLQMVNKDLMVMNQKLETELQKLEKDNTYLKYQISTHRLLFSENKLLKESLKNVLDFRYNDMLMIKHCSIGFDLLRKYFDTEDYPTIVEDFMKRCEESKEYKYELVQLIERSPIVIVGEDSSLNFFFKIKSFTAIQLNNSGEPLLEKRHEKYFCSEIPRYNYELFLSKWAITLTNVPVDLSKPDERFKLSPQPFINDIYGCFVISKTNI